MPYVKDGVEHYYMWERVRDGLIDLSQELTSASLNVTKQRNDDWDWRPTGEQTDALITRLNISSTVCMDLARAVDRNLRDRDALLELADEMEEFGNLPVNHPGIRVLQDDDFSRELGYARRIRAAIGMDDAG